MIHDIPEPEISLDFIIDDIHKIRERHYEILKDATQEEWCAFYNKGADNFMQQIKELCKEKKNTNSIVIKPVSEISGEFDEEILADLIARGFSGAELLLKFKEIRKQIRPAALKMLKEATLVAQDKTEYSTYEDVFGKEGADDA